MTTHGSSDKTADMASDGPGAVILGYAEPIQDKYLAETISDLCTSRIGGPTQTPKTMPPLHRDTLRCKSCKKDMSLLLQLFAPEGTDRPHAYVRVVYVFTCRDGKCAEVGWSKSFKVLRGQSSAVDVHVDESVETRGEAFKPYELVSEAEPLESVAAPSTSTSKASSSVKRDVVRKKSSEPEADYSQLLVENDGSEKYVKVKGDATFHKFNKRLRRAPEQVVRYYRSATPLSSSYDTALWISTAHQLKDADIPKCSACSGPRSLEFQIMPTLLNFLDVDDTQKDALDWGQLSIYTCDAACEAANKDFVEEVLWRQEYDMKTSIF